MKNKNNNSSIPLWIFFTLALGVLIGYGVRNVTSGKPTFKITSKVSELDQVLAYVKEHYVDSVDVNKIKEDAISSALKDLDPHSIYLSSEVVSRDNEQMEGEYEGIGIEFSIIDDTVQVVTAMTGGPSREVGIYAGDKIITVNDSTIAGVEITNSDVISLLKGPGGTTVNVGIKRGKKNNLLNFEITRAPIAINSVDVAYMISDDVGYIKINRFSLKTSQEFRVHLDKLVKTGMNNLIIDLRGNGGGIMQDALELLDEIIDGQKLLLSAEGRNYRRTEYKALLQGLYETGRLAILIDEGSASASEIVAGAVQDWDRGVIIGRRTFGKGLVQQSYNLRGGSALRLTVARYFTPSGRSIQRSYKNGVENYYSDYYDRLNNGELMSRDSIKEDSTLIKYTLLNERPVFGGGGIMPDVFVPVDTTATTNFSAKVFSERLPSEFVYQYYSNNESQLSAYESATAFENKFLFSSILYQQFVNYVNKQLDEENFSASEIAASKENLSHYMKALLARQLFGDEGFYVVMNDSDDVILKTLSILQDGQYDAILKPVENL